MRGFDQTTLPGEIIQTSDSAVLVDLSGDPFEDETIWIPRRCCIDGSSLDVGDTDLIVANWWLKEKGYL